MQMCLDYGLPKLKPLRFDARKSEISLFLVHCPVKDGAFIPVQLAPDAFAQSNELFVVACLVGSHRKVRHPIEQLQLVAALGVLVDLIAPVMDGIAIVIDQCGKDFGQQPSLCPRPPRLSP